MRFACVFAPFVLVIVPAAASADPIVTFATRFAFAGASGITQTSTDVPTAFASAGSSDLQGWSRARSSMTTSIDPMDLSGSGYTLASAQTRGAADASARTFYYVGLQLDQAYDFTFNATFTGSSMPSHDSALPSVYAGWETWLRTRPNGPEQFHDRGEQATTSARAGRLSAGDWQLFVFDYASVFVPLGGSVRSMSDYTFSLNLTPASGPAPSPTPEPASMLLLSTGVLGAMRARRRP